jgi:hypothetical protein
MVQAREGLLDDYVEVPKKAKPRVKIYLSHPTKLMQFSARIFQ